MRQLRPLALVLALLQPQWNDAFSRIVPWRTPGVFGGRNEVNCACLMTTTLSLSCSKDDDEYVSLPSRRTLFQTLPFLAGAWMLPTEAFAADVVGSSPERPVAVLGASGRTGMEVAQALAKEGLYSVTMSRSGRDPFQTIRLDPKVQFFIEHYPDPVNVVQQESLRDALTKAQASAIIFCASASRQGGTAFEVDDEGVGNAAEVARDLPARFVLVSSVAVDRPNSKSYQITNTLGGNLNGIMDAKLQGENKVRSILKKKKDYVIVRPGVLMNGKSKNGPLDMEVNQEDKIGGGLSRDELAGVTVGALLSGKRGATVEVYRRSTATPLQPSFTVPSGKEAQSDSYVGLFESVVPDQ